MYWNQGSLFLVSGRLSDLLGGKRCCLFGTALFALGVLITGFLHSDIAVYAIRGLSGVGNVIGMTSAYSK
jgi:MFS family permease